jgi:hypothetical protein
MAASFIFAEACGERSSLRGYSEHTVEMSTGEKNYGHCLFTCGSCMTENIFGEYGQRSGDNYQRVDQPLRRKPMGLLYLCRTHE